MRKLDTDTDAETRGTTTRAKAIALWQATAKREYRQPSYGRNPFRVGDWVIVRTPTMQGYERLRGQVTRTADRFEKYAVDVEVLDRGRRKKVKANAWTCTYAPAPCAPPRKIIID